MAQITIRYDNGKERKFEGKGHIVLVMTDEGVQPSYEADGVFTVFSLLGAMNEAEKMIVEAVTNELATGEKNATGEADAGSPATVTVRSDILQ